MNDALEIIDNLTETVTLRRGSYSGRYLSATGAGTKEPDRATHFTAEELQVVRDAVAAIDAGRSPRNMTCAPITGDRDYLTNTIAAHEHDVLATYHREDALEIAHQYL